MIVNYGPKKTTSFMPDAQAQTPPVQAQVPPIFTDLEPIERRQKLADAIMAGGSDSSPLPANGLGILGGFARLGQAVAGGYFSHKAEQQLKDAKTSNKASLLDAFNSGDLSTLLTSGDPIGEKVGGVLLEQESKRDPGHYETYNGDTLWVPNKGGKPEVISKKTRPLVTDGMISMDEGETWSKIPDFVKNAKAIADAKRAPPKTTADQSGILPWQRKW